MIKFKKTEIFPLLFSSCFAITFSVYAEEQNFDYKNSALLATGKLEATDPTYRRLNSNNGDTSDICPVVVSPNATAVAYDTVVLNNPNPQPQNISAELLTENCQQKDSFLFVYENAFTPASPQNNCIHENDDIDNNNLCSTVKNITLPPFSKTIFVITAVKNFLDSYNNPNPAGQFSWSLRLGGDTIYKNQFESM